MARVPSWRSGAARVRGVACSTPMTRRTSGSPHGGPTAAAPRPARPGIGRCGGSNSPVREAGSYSRVNDPSEPFTVSRAGSHPPTQIRTSALRPSAARSWTTSSTSGCARGIAAGRQGLDLAQQRAGRRRRPAEIPPGRGPAGGLRGRFKPDSPERAQLARGDAWRSRATPGWRRSGRSGTTTAPVSARLSET